MARPCKRRRVWMEPEYCRFLPDGTPPEGCEVLTVDEFEAVRLLDLEGCTQEQCAGQMGIARSTVADIHESARRKIAGSLVYGRPLLISGGHYHVCGTSPGAPAQAPQRKEAIQMRIAVTYEDGMVFQHFGHSEQFKLYDVENGQVTAAQVVDTNGQGHGALAGFLTAAQVDVLLCGGIGGGAQAALAQAGIQLFGGVTGPADKAVADYLAGTLHYVPGIRCDHHDHGHDHDCGSHGCGGGCHH